MSEKKATIFDILDFPIGKISTLGLHSLEIKNFRCFEHLVIEKLGRVNLIVGKNSVGKTSLLEAIWLMASGASWPVIHSILYDRNELVRYNLSAKRAQQEQIEAVKSFFNRPPTKTVSASFRIGGKDAGVLEPRVPVHVDDDGKEHYDEKATHAEQTVIEFELQHDNAICIKGDPNPGYIEEPEWPDLPKEKELLDDTIAKSVDDGVVFIPVKGLPWQAQAKYWDEKSPRKDKSILDCLRQVVPDIEGFRFKGDKTEDQVRYPAVSTERFPDEVPLAKLGEGAERVLALALAMSAASYGYLLIDEFETGLHHSVQASIWQAVFSLAKEWNVQIFATTHSWDCVAAFQEAAAESDDDDARLISLEKTKGGQAIQAQSYNKSLMKAVVEQGIEVR
ncbi:MAG: AAA family ATPase [Candidatus Methylumidiphilus sp.]